MIVLTGLLLPIIAGASLFAVDHIAVANKKAALQKAADAAAIAAARELHFIQISIRADDTTLNAIADGYARQNMPGENLRTVATAESETRVNVDLALTFKTLLGKVFESEKTLTANAKAEIYGGQNICIIAADVQGNKAGMYLEGASRIDAKECGIYVNQRSRSAIRAKDSSFIDATFVCAAGGYNGGKGNVENAVTTDCPQIKDPLELRPFPTTASCDPSLPSSIGRDENVTLSPGTYCGGLTIDGNARVEFLPGIHSFKDGPLLIDGDATVTGENVGLHFADERSYFEFNGNADITFSAPQVGPMAGIVISARTNCRGTSRRCGSIRDFRITSPNVRSLLGTIYMPIDDLIIDTTMPISEDAAFTILIVDNLYMKQSPVLVLNTDYAATSVPVPDGFRGEPSTRIVQ